MNLQQLQQQVQQLAPAIAYVVTQREGEKKHFTLTMVDLKGIILPWATAEAVLEFVRSHCADCGTRIGQGESVDSITRGEDPLEF
jgi:hypothetical protein